MVSFGRGVERARVSERRAHHGRFPEEQNFGGHGLPKVLESVMEGEEAEGASLRT
jgi:hypothetical protein